MKLATYWMFSLKLDPNHLKPHYYECFNVNNIFLIQLFILQFFPVTGLIIQCPEWCASLVIFIEALLLSVLGVEVCREVQSL